MSIIPIPSIEEPGITLWLVDLDGTSFAPDDPSLTKLLSDAERAKASRFRLERDARRYRASHTALRMLLSKETGMPSHEVQFVEGRFGKPRLRTPEALHFNMSHSGGWALIGFSATAPIGVDIELPRPIDDLPALAEQNFCTTEFAALQAIEPSGQLRAFLQCWTRKEACLKALGSGLSIEPCVFEAGIETATQQTSIKVGEQKCNMAVTSVALPVKAVAACAWIPPSDRFRPV